MERRVNAVAEEIGDFFLWFSDRNNPPQCPCEPDVQPQSSDFRLAVFVARERGASSRNSAGKGLLMFSPESKVSKVEGPGEGDISDPLNSFDP